MGNFLQLLIDRRVDFWMIMAMEIGPDRGVRIQIAAAFHIAQDGSVSGNDYDRFALQPIAHLREGMPQEPVIQLRQPVHFWFRTHELLLRPWRIV